MIEAYCATCDDRTQQEEWKLFQVIPSGHCTQCEHATYLTETLPWPILLIVGDEFQAHLEKKAAWISRQAEDVR